MGVPDIEAEHITLVLENASSRAEALPDEHIHQLNRSKLAFLEGPGWYRGRGHPFSTKCVR